MNKYYSVGIRVSFGVLADSTEEAEEIARQLIDLDDVPARVVVSVDAYLTPNQSESIKREAVNT